MLEMFLCVLEEDLQIEINPPLAPIARMDIISKCVKSLIAQRSPTPRTPAKAGGGWTCVNCNKFNFEAYHKCFWCDSPRPGG